MKSATQLRKHIYAAIDALQRDYQAGSFVPLLEADIVFYLAHLLLKSKAVRLSELFRDARVVGAGSRKVDLAVGNPVYAKFGRLTRRGVDMVAAVEVKFLGIDRPQGEHNLQLGEITEDIVNLGSLRKKNPNGVFVVLAVDEARYLQKPRKQSAATALYNAAEKAGVLLRRLDLTPPVSRSHGFVRVGGFKLVVGQKLYAHTKSGVHVATVTGGGMVAHGGKEYESLTAAGKAITGRSTDGPGFWGLASRAHKGGGGGRMSKKPPAAARPKLAPYACRSFKIRHNFMDGTTREARVLKDGSIKMGVKVFDSPTGAARAVVNRSVDGWLFWRYRDKQGEWVQLDELRGGR